MKIANDQRESFRILSPINKREISNNGSLRTRDTLLGKSDILCFEEFKSRDTLKDKFIEIQREVKYWRSQHARAVEREQKLKHRFSQST